jgi:hypothetical protein
MLPNELDSSELSAVVADLAQLHRWELDNIPYMRTMTGRHLYFATAQRAVGEHSQHERSLKELFSSPHLTEKALRTRMQDMLADDLFVSRASATDTRNKYLLPTEKFYELVYAHADQARKIFKSNFLMFRRQG